MTALKIKKLLRKLPDWLVQCLNKEVVQTMNESGYYPDFQQFVKFINTESNVACHPVSSLHALYNGNTSINKPKAKVLATAVTDANSSAAPERKCEYCHENGHLIFKCKQFLEQTVDKGEILSRAITYA